MTPDFTCLPSVGGGGGGGGGTPSVKVIGRLPGAR